MKLKILAIIMMISAGSTLSVAQTKKKAPHKTGDESKTEAKTRQGIKHSNAADTKEGNPASPGKRTTRPGTGNGLAPNTNVKGNGEGSGPGSDAGVGLNSGVGSSTASSGGSGAVPASDGTSDGTNTRPRATRNMAGSPLPSKANFVETKKPDKEKLDANKSSKPSAGKTGEQKPAKEKRKRRG